MRTYLGAAREVMGLTQSRRSLCAHLLLYSTPVIPAASMGQSAELRGLVTDSAGVPISAAVVEVRGVTGVTRTNDDGEFRLSVPPGLAEIHVRRLGFAALTQQAKMAAGESQTVHVALAPVATNIQPIVVQAARVEDTGRLAGYYERLRRHSNGSFVTREELDRGANKPLTQLLGATAGVSATRTTTGGGSLRMRGMRCRPLVWLDGVPMPAGEVDLDAFPASTLQGVEMYLGATNAPPAYSPPPGMSSCGTVLLWSRGRDTEVPEFARSLVDLEELAAAHSIYMPDQVDMASRLQERLAVRYPPELAATRTSGSALAEFVVSENGDVEPGSMRVVTATHHSFAQAAMQALLAAHFSPAMKGGVAVRQLVQQPFTFSFSDAAPPSARQ
jgi:TonB family protein